MISIFSYKFDLSPCVPSKIEQLSCDEHGDNCDMVQIKFTIDNRERNLVEYIRTNCDFGDDVQVVVESMPVGDIKLSLIDEDDNSAAPIVFERKTVSDMSTSIKDGRFDEQKQRLVAAYGIDRVCIIIEGQFYWSIDCKSFSKQVRIDKSSFAGKLLNASFRDQFRIIQTTSIKDTALFLKEFAKRCCKTPQAYFYRRSPTDNQPLPYVPNVIKIKKKDNIDETVCFLMQLSCIPCMSYKKSELISKHLAVTSMRSLMSMLESSKDPIKLLCSVPGIGKVIAQSVTKFTGTSPSAQANATTNKIVTNKVVIDLCD